MHHVFFGSGCLTSPRTASRSSKDGVQGATDKDIECRRRSGDGGGDVSRRKEQLLEGDVRLFLSPNDGDRLCGRRG